MAFNSEKIRMDFPILKRKIYNNTLIYFDNAASAQKPYSVINAERIFYKYNYSAVNRGVHTLSTNATYCVEEIREKVANFINASSKEIIFVKGATEGINLVVNSWGNKNLKNGDNIIITEMEHHSNIVPWQMLAKRLGIEIRILPMEKNGDLKIDKLDSLIDKKTKIFSFTHISNVLGTINPIKSLVKKVKKLGILTLIDGAQAVMYEKVNVKDINCDFYVFSGHKIYGPTGIGILYVRNNLFKNMSPWQGGGSMISNVDFENNTSFTEFPWCFEAGSPNTAGIIGLGAALEYIKKIGLENIKKHEKYLIQYIINKFKNFSDITIYGNPHKRSGIISFNIGKYHSYDIGTFLDNYGIAIRTGHQCAIPIMRFYNVSGMCRVSFGIYNNHQEIDKMMHALAHIKNILKN